VKFEVLMQKMREFGCERLVTGHYARVRRDQDGRYRLLQARGSAKDQSYVLYMLGQEQLRCLWFPLGELRDKSQTRQMAAELGLHLAEKPDSQEICFVSEAGGYSEFLRSARPEIFGSGEIVDDSGKRVGSHDGVASFTVGQRRGLGVSKGSPLYVLRLEPATNRVVVGDADQLLRSQVELKDLFWSVPVEPRVRVTAKIRSNMEAQPATLYAGPEPRLVFDDPVRAVTPGQIAVAYRGKTVAAGGVIA
jgi:tRNA-specific 2-thiouridylase